jgi:hypothetical protein
MAFGLAFIRFEQVNVSALALVPAMVLVWLSSARGEAMTFRFCVTVFGLLSVPATVLICTSAARGQSGISRAKRLMEAARAMLATVRGIRVFIFVFVLFSFLLAGVSNRRAVTFISTPQFEKSLKIFSTIRETQFSLINAA